MFGRELASCRAQLAAMGGVEKDASVSTVSDPPGRSTAFHAPVPIGAPEPSRKRRKHLAVRENEFLIWGVCLPIMYWLSWVTFDIIDSAGSDLSKNKGYITIAVLCLGLPGLVYLISKRERGGLSLFLVVWTFFSFIMHTINGIGSKVEKYWPTGFLEVYYRIPVYMLAFSATMIALGLTIQFVGNEKLRSFFQSLGKCLIGVMSVFLILLILRHFSPSDPILNPLLRFLGLM
jgi:hypothetical protein